MNEHKVVLHTQMDPETKLDNGDKKLFLPVSQLGQPKESARVPPAAKTWNFSFKMCSLEV